MFGYTLWLHSHLIFLHGSVSSFRHYVEQVVSIRKRCRHGSFLPLAWILGLRSLTDDEDGQLSDDEDYKHLRNFQSLEDIEDGWFDGVMM